MEQESLKSYPPLGPMDESALDTNTSYAHILHLIEGSPRVVDFGCGPGNLARFLTQRGCAVVGVEINPESAGLAREYCSDVLVADLDTVPLLQLFPTERFDVAIFADILEHLRKPERLLAEVTRILRPGGYVIASIPNIAHGAIRLAMLEGEFNYQEIGILDDTHLRFFTRKTTEKLFEDAGLFIEDITRTTAPVFEPSGTLVPSIKRADFSDDVASKIEADPEAETVQFIVKALPATSAEARTEANKRKTAALQIRVQELEGQLRAAQAELAEKPEGLTPEHFEAVQAQLHMALKGPEGVEALQAQLGQKSEELDKLRDQMTALAAREQSTNRREKKLAEENVKVAGSVVQLQKEVEAHRETIRQQRSELETVANNAHEAAAALEKLRAEMHAAATEKKKSAETMAELKKSLDAREVTIQTQRAELDAAAKAAQEGSVALEMLRADMGSIAAEKAKAAEAIAELKRKIGRLDDERRTREADLAQTRGAIDELQGSIATLEVEVEAARDDVAEARMQTRSLTTLYKSSEAQRLQLGIEIDELRGEYSRAKQSYAAAFAEIDQLRSELGERQNAERAVEQQVIEAERDRAHAVAELEKLQTELGKRESAQSALKQRTTEVERHYAHAVAELEKARTELGKRESARQAFEQRAHEAERHYAHAVAELDTLRSEVDRRETAHKRAQELHEETESHLRRLSDELDDLREQYAETRAHAVAELEKLQTELGARERAQSALKQRTTEVEGHYAHAIAELEKARTEYAQTLVDLNRAQAAAAELTTRYERDEFYLEEMRKSKFWRLRNGWFSVKRAFGITTDIP